MNINIIVFQGIMVDIREKHTNILDKPVDPTFGVKEVAFLGYATV
jgi:hypothetical protein